MHYNLVCVFQPSDTRSDNGLFDVIYLVQSGLQALGHTVSVSRNLPRAGARNIVFGAHADKHMLEKLRNDDIVFNLEQLCDSSPWFGPEYVELLKTHTTWDYSKKNILGLKNEHGIESQFCRLAFAPERAVLDRNFPKDIDILFYGAINKRRQAILSALSESPFRVKVTTNAFGKERDGLIARSKIILNIHYYDSAILETARLSYLWTNHKAVVSEAPEREDMYPELENACFFSPYDKLAEAAIWMVYSEKRRLEQEEKGYTAFSSVTMKDVLEPMVGKSQHSIRFSPYPTALNVGSGKDFRPDHLNVDINADWQPDVVMDMSVPLDDGQIMQAGRFGEIKLEFDSFSRVIIHDVLEHVPSVIDTMTNVANLLEEGGEVDIIVPYDLSCEAWQDPTHIRAFNEQSWKYYCEWSWYIGWREYTFNIVDLSMTIDGSVPEEQRNNLEIIKKPRSVTAMHVILRKRATTAAEKMAYDVHHGKFYKKADS